MREAASAADPATRLPPPDPAVAAKASESVREVRGMTKTGAPIVAQALMDPESQKLLATGDLILDSRWLGVEEARMVNGGERPERLRFSEDLSRKDTNRRS